MWNLRGKINNKNKPIDTENKLIVARYEGSWAGWGRWTDQEEQIVSYKIIMGT